MVLVVYYPSSGDDTFTGKPLTEPGVVASVLCLVTAVPPAPLQQRW